jgi:hypothetical protein
VSDAHARPAAVDRRDRTERWSAAALALLALAFVGYGLLAIARYGLTELYADQWRQYLPYLDRPFPTSAFAADNGHRAVVPSLIRLLENAWFDGNQRLQLATGGAFALAAWLVLAGLALRERTLSLTARFLVLALAACALFWLGNARMLLHGNESTQVYLVIACQVGAALLASRPGAGVLTVAGVCLLGLVATFSFGPGLAVFPAAAIVFTLQRRWRAAATVLAATGLTLAAYLLLPGGDGVRNTLVIAPLTNLHTAATWLASMWVTLLQPLIEVDAGRALPLGLDASSPPLARLYAATLGNPWIDHGPFALVGWLGLVGLAWHSWRAWIAPSVGRLALVGLGCAWFALGVAGIVALGRLEYFAAHPGQIFANRYVPWSCLFWFGLLAGAIGLRARPVAYGSVAATSAPVAAGAAGVGAVQAGAEAGVRRPAAGAGRAGRAPRWVWLPAGVMLVMAVLTTPGHRAWAKSIQQGVRLDSAGFVSGVIEAQRLLGETIAEEVMTALPAIRAAGLSAFAWPEARLQGRPVALLAADADAGAVVRATPVGNRLHPGNAVRLQLKARGQADAGMPERLLVASQGVAVGVLVHQRIGPGWNYAGYARAGADDALALGPLLDDGRVQCWTGCPPASAPR